MRVPVTHDAGLVPRPVRTSLLVLLGLVVAAAVYLTIVRGPVMLLDLAATTIRAICF
jgi:hypothetical protein